MEEYYNPEPSPMPNYSGNTNNLVPSGEGPAGAKIISIWYYLNAAAVLTIMALIIINYFNNSLGGRSVFVILIPAILDIGLVILLILIGKGLWTGKSWARAPA